MSKADSIFLTTPLLLEEIERVVKDSDGLKSSGLNRFNFAFVKEFWDLMKEEIRILFDQFHGSSRLPKCLFSYFLTLILKTKSPLSLGDFRPISLLGCLYKLVSKVLAGRLAKAISSVVAHTPSAFIKRRQLMDVVMVVGQVGDYAKCIK
jgi:hypothetical protein